MQKLAGTFNAKLTLEPELLSQTGCQGVILALPPDQNLLYGKLFLKQGLDLFIQKPLATTYKDARELFDISVLEKRILMGGSDIRYRPDILKAKALIKQGYIGETRYLHGQFCHVLNSSGWRQDVFQDMGEHVVSVVRELMGTPEQVTLKRHGALSGQLYFEAASWFADARLSWESTRGDVPEITVEGTKGTLYLNTSGSSQIDFHKVRKSTDGNLGRMPQLRDWLTNPHEKMHCKGPHSYTRKLRDFLEAMVSRPPTTSFIEDLEGFHTICEVLTSFNGVAESREPKSLLAKLGLIHRE